jgi:hypothetical protein
MKEHISDSQVNSWNFCPRSWYLKSVEGWEAKVKPQALAKGGQFHKSVEKILTDIVESTPDHETLNAEQWEDAVAHHFPEVSDWIAENAQREFDELLNSGLLTDEKEEELRERTSALVWMVSHHFKGLIPSLAGCRVVGVEMPFEHESAEFVNRGVIDLLVYDPALNRITIIDHKSAADLLETERRLAHSMQMVGYQRWVSAQVKGGAFEHVPVDAEILCIYHVVRSKCPKAPNINKDGSVSIAAVSTIRSFYEEALAGQDKPPTEAQLKRLETLPVEWILRFSPMIDQSDIDQWMIEMTVSAERMAQARALPMYATRNTSNCSECQLRVLCHFGSDPNFTKKETK